MKRKLLKPVVALLLGICTSAAVAQYTVDTREMVTLSKEEKAWLMNEMRGHFLAIQTIIAATAQGDSASAQQAATDRGTKHLSDPTRLKFPQKTSESWKAFATAMHKGFDGVADSISHGAPREETLVRVAGLMQNCIGCHSTYRIVEEREH